MNYLKIRQIKKLYFGYEELARILGISLSSAKVTASRFVKSGILIRIKRNIYILNDKWYALDREGKFGLANLLQTPSCISLMTAMDYYGITTQIQRDYIESISIYRTKEIEIEKNIFKFSKIDRNLYFSFTREKGFFIASPEKAFLDAFYLMSLKRYTFDLTSIDYNKLNLSDLNGMVKRYPAITQRLFKIKANGYIKKTRNI